MSRHVVTCLAVLAALVAAPAGWGAETEKPPPPLEIPEVVVEGSDPTAADRPAIQPSDPALEAQISPPPLGPSLSEQEMSKLSFHTQANLFPEAPLPAAGGRTSLRGGFGGLDLYGINVWDARQAGGFSSFWQGEWRVGTALVAPWLKQTLGGGFGLDLGGLRLSLGGDLDRVARGNPEGAGQLWGAGRLGIIQPVPGGQLAYRLGWESGTLAAGGSDAQAHGGDLAVRYEPRWGDHRPLIEAGGGYHWGQRDAWPTAGLLLGDRFRVGASHWETGLRYQLVGYDHSVAPDVRVDWRGWPETLVSAHLDGGQQSPFAGTVWRSRPYAQVAEPLRSEHAYARLALGLERRLVPGLVLGLGADAAGVDRKLYWAQVDQGPYWQLRNAPGPMLVWGGNAALRYELGPVTPYARYQLRQAAASDPGYPTDGSHDLRGGLQLQVGRLQGDVSVHMLAWALSAASSGQAQGVQPNVLLLDGRLAYEVTDHVQLQLTLTDWLLKSNDLLPGYWEPAFTALGGIGWQF